VKSAASIEGHPIHPMVVAFPIAFWLGSFVADIVYLSQRDAFWYRASWYAMAAGLAGALIAAIPGGIDYFKSVAPHSVGKKTALLHGLLNLSLSGLYAFNLWWRSGEDALTGSDWWVAFGLSIAGVAVLGVAGWLGGDLVYKCEIGIEKFQVNSQETIYGPSLKGESGAFVEVAKAGELGVGQMKHVTINGAWIALVRTNEGYFAIDEICTHEGAPLCDGVLMGHVVQCPWHGSRFDVRTGKVLAGPAEVSIRTFEVRNAGGSIRVQAPKSADVAVKAGGRQRRALPKTTLND
jgi:uncharacterized membrane protein/nitrite reductase/ring-hydroxylating ferredoxin subunit